MTKKSKKSKRSSFLESRKGVNPFVNQKGAQVVYTSKKGLGPKKGQLPRKTF